MRRLVLKVQVWVVSPCLASLPRMETGRVTALSFLLNIRLSASVGLPELQISQFDKRKGKVCLYMTQHLGGRNQSEQANHILLTCYVSMYSPTLPSVSIKDVKHSSQINGRIH
ncbi:uncharacterized protein LOC135098469 [Scylla paramamosain]|uniref:uncharacterized protein LOC135098469 n=1 Tax=Scylla paramamosain TaxID=85552 RepID=UPI003083EB92